MKLETLDQAITAAIIKSYLKHNINEIEDKIIADKSSVLQKVSNSFTEVSSMAELSQLKRLHKEIGEAYDIIFECLVKINMSTYRYKDWFALEKTQRELNRLLDQFEEMSACILSETALKDRYNVLRLISEGLYKKLVIQ